jgi:hypothetical protein
MSRLWTGSKEFTLVDQRILVAATVPSVDAIKAALRSAGVIPQLMDTLEETVHVLEFQQPEFLIFSEGFASSDMKLNPLLDYIQWLSGDPRRNFFAVFIGPRVKSGDLLTAFSYGVNLVLHPDHLSDLVERIGKSWSTWKDLYQPYMQTRIDISGH